MPASVAGTLIMRFGASTRSHTCWAWRTVADASWATSGVHSKEMREVLVERLTEHQRFVIIAPALNRVPIDVLAGRLGTTRQALYQTLHEERLVIRIGLSERRRIADDGDRAG
jgi:hypothetical protein